MSSVLWRSLKRSRSLRGLCNSPQARAREAGRDLVAGEVQRLERERLAYGRPRSSLRRKRSRIERLANHHVKPIFRPLHNHFVTFFHPPTFQKKLGPAPKLFFPLPSQTNLFPVQGIYLPKSYLPTSSQAPFLLISSPRHPADFYVTFFKWA